MKSFSNSKVKVKFFCIVFLVIEFLLSNILNAFADNINVFVQAKLDTDKILIGDQIHFDLILQQPAGEKIDYPVLKDSLISKIPILSAPSFDTTTNPDGSLKITSRYLITCFDSGTYLVPPLPFVIHGAQTDTIKTLPVNLFVNNVKTEKGKFYDIKGPLSIPISLRELLKYLGLLLAIGLIIYLLIYVIIRRKNKKPLFRAERPLDPAHVIAMRELEALKANKLWQQGKIKQYYTGITDIIRVYIEHRFNVPALESTSDEILDSMKTNKIIENESLVYLEDVLRLADLVKFAKAQPLPDENENSWTYAYTFVLNTKTELKPEISIEGQPTVDGNTVNEIKTK